MSDPKSRLDRHDQVAEQRARRITLGGHVQGVGFRPFVYRLAQQHGLTGWVQNERGRVAILVQGPSTALEAFGVELLRRPPPMSKPEMVAEEFAAPLPLENFCILPSKTDADAHVFVPPDQYACEACIRELEAPDDRRYRYPFINCTHCGPRYTLISSMPYDRSNTSMASFPLCESCRAEYANPSDRRFHAEPIACPDCGPALEFVDAERPRLGSESALLAAVEALRSGAIVAVKGVGGYHLMCDGCNDAAVLRLRLRKQRPDKPFAIMFPLAGADGLEAAGKEVRLSPVAAAALMSPIRPIVLMPKRLGGRLSPHVAPRLTELGVFLPYSPLHYLLVSEFGGPLVATSGNLSGEPVLTENQEAERRLAPIADVFLHHDRPILRPADDPVCREIRGRVRPVRLGRGSAPLELQLPLQKTRPVLALGGQMKVTVALSWEDRIVISPHVGDMESPRSLAVFESVVEDLQDLYGIRAEAVVCDAHPGYTTNRWARTCGLPVTQVVHHFAHASALAGEHELNGSMLVFAWDGVGFGADGTLWGGETLLGAPGRWKRVASLREFHLPGGERAAREPWRSAAALCWEANLAWEAGPKTEPMIYQAWQRGLNCPETTAVGRVFDAAAAIVAGIEHVSYEGQGPMILESMASGDGERVPLSLHEDSNGVKRLDWEPLLAHLLDDSYPAAVRAASVHHSLAHSIVDQARLFRAEYGTFDVGLTGGVFQNARLTAAACALLEAEGFTIRLGTRVPCNDAGLSYGQAVEFAASYGIENMLSIDAATTR